MEAAWGRTASIIGTVRKTATGVTVQVRLVDVATGRTALGKEYSGTLKNPRLYAHTASDEIHQQQRACAASRGRSSRLHPIATANG